MNKLIVYLTGILIVLLISSCGEESQKSTETPFTPLETNPTIQIPTPIIITTPTATLTDTPLPSPKKTILHSTATYTPTPQMIENVSSILDCSGGGISHPPDEDFSIPGTIVYRGTEGTLYTIGGSSLTKSKIVTEDLWIDVIGFSPDGTWLAYSPEEPEIDPMSSTTRKIILLSNKGERIELTVEITGFQSEIGDDEYIDGFNDNLSYWINNNLIYAMLDLAKPNNSGPITNHTLTKFLNPFDGTWDSSVLEDLPNWTPYWEMEDNSVGLSPDLSRVMYMSKSGLVLRDREKDANLWVESSYTDKWYSGVLINWNPASTMVVVATWNRIGDQVPPLMMSRDGMNQRWIGNNEFPSTNGFSVVRAISWSPDGQRLALAGQANLGDNIIPYLYIYDTKPQKFVYRCPIIRTANDLPQKIFWSPDGQYIAYAFLENNQEDPLQVLNIQSGELTTIVQGAYIVGWSDKFPAEWP